MRLLVCGSRGSTPVAGAEFLRYGGNTSCIAIAHDGALPTLIVDAGTGIRNLNRVFEEKPFRGTIALGHLHWDHTQGLPFFHPGDNDDAEVRLVMPAQGPAADVLRRMMSPPFFPIEPEELRGRWTFEGLEPGSYDLSGFAVTAREIPHKGGRAFGYRIDDGLSSIAYLSDHSPTSVGAGTEGLGELHSEAVELSRDVDLLIHDSQHTADELPEKAFLGHAAGDYAVRLGEAAGAKEVLLFHHDPDRTDDEIDAALTEIESSIPVTAAREGSTIDLPRGVER